jgi:hypothetical protein
MQDRIVYNPQLSSSIYIYIYIYYLCNTELFWCEIFPLFAVLVSVTGSVHNLMWSQQTVCTHTVWLSLSYLKIIWPVRLKRGVILVSTWPVQICASIRFNKPITLHFLFCLIPVNHLMATEVSLSCLLLTSVVSVSGGLWHFMLMFLKHPSPVQGVLRDFQWKCSMLVQILSSFFFSRPLVLWFGFF